MISNFFYIFLRFKYNVVDFFNNPLKREEEPILGFKSKKNKRILWLLNHKTLMNFELPLLEKLGFEVYVPKKRTKRSIRNDNVDFSYDKKLSIPLKIINELNQFNFYEKEFTPRILKIINSFFDYVFLIPTFYVPLRYMLKFFKGKILLRVFGREHPCNYCSLIEAFLGKQIWKNIEKTNQQIWFATAYNQIVENENDFLQKRALFLPIGFPIYLEQFKNIWTGGINKIMFVCPSIKTQKYYKKVYDDFLKEMNVFDYNIFGVQHQKINENKKVIGWIEDQQYYQALSKYQVMFYHSQEPRHLHYHPLEAMLFGMPVIFMKGGLISRLGKGIVFPGESSDYQEAREKIKRVLNADNNFIFDIKNSQKHFLQQFYFKNCLQVWGKKIDNI